MPWLVPPATSPTIHATITHSAGNLTEVVSDIFFNLFFLMKVFSQVFVKNQFSLQGKVRERTVDAVGMIWDMLPITEKTKDEIDFSKVPEGVKITCDEFAS